VNEWLALLEDKFPCGPINNFEQVFSMPHVKERGMLVNMKHPTINDLTLVGSPLKMSETPVEYRLPPPLMGEHTDFILQELLGYSSAEINKLRTSEAIR
jgi:crotonobetainyl-CoA:carnitine CoA-transferase CaiB-like acyl-CoA transferase